MKKEGKGEDKQQIGTQANIHIMVAAEVSGLRHEKNCT